MRFIVEHYLTFKENKEDKDKYLDKVWDLLEKSYASKGGIKGCVKEDLLSPNILWKLVRKNGDIVAVSIYKVIGDTRKAIAAGTDMTSLGKESLYSIIAEDVTETNRKVWAEVSGAPEHMFKKKGAEMFPADLAEKVLKNLGKDIISKSDDGYHYTRLIDGIPYEKVMVGQLPICILDLL